MNGEHAFEYEEDTSRWPNSVITFDDDLLHVCELHLSDGQTTFYSGLYTSDDLAQADATVRIARWAGSNQTEPVTFSEWVTGEAVNNGENNTLIAHSVSGPTLHGTIVSRRMVSDLPRARIVISTGGDGILGDIICVDQKIDVVRVNYDVTGLNPDDVINDPDGQPASITNSTLLIATEWVGDIHRLAAGLPDPGKFDFSLDEIGKDQDEDLPF